MTRQLTIFELRFFRLNHKNTSLSEVARRYRVSRQYAHQLWSEYHPNTNYNESWGAKKTCFCKFCNKEFAVRAKIIERGGGIYCSSKCSINGLNSKGA